MKRSRFKTIMAGLWALAVVSMSGMTALAADTVDVTGSGSYANGTHVEVGYADKDLFSNMKGLMPGDVVSNTVNLQNQSSRGVSIYMKAYPDFTKADETGKKAVRADSQASPEEKTFKEDILNKTEMTLTLGGKVIYQGSADGASPKAGYEALTAGSYGIKLGYFEPGRKEDLVITLALPGESFDNAYTDSFDVVDWVFCVEGTTPSSHHDRDDDDDGNSTRYPSGTATTGTKTPGPDLHGDPNHLVITDPGVLPKMGDAGISGYVFGILAAILIGCGALYMRKRYRSV